MNTVRMPRCNTGTTQAPIFQPRYAARKTAPATRRPKIMETKK